LNNYYPHEPRASAKYEAEVMIIILGGVACQHYPRKKYTATPQGFAAMGKGKLQTKQMQQIL
jgi:hypothetical protein